MNKVILFQGDSVTDCNRSRDTGIRDNQGLGEGYPMLVAARLCADNPETGLKIINRGISGNRVVDLYARWKIDTLNLRPDILSIMIGVNDTWHEKDYQNGVEVPRYEMVYRELLKWTKEVLPNCKIILCEPFVLQFSAVTAEWIPEMTQRQNIVRKLAEEFGALFIPFQTVISNAARLSAPELILEDGVHPLLAGHQILADAWIKAVREAGIL